ncbi:MAG: crossover junction endodeoxyribonuclease RuvC [Oscillospiraceae bacterium]|jgi:crossover junction endodeoxyribonuclease RuvC|nr:crossover junction endodeoxyribonuclease RuvC [Oscillospiraceae bacterium]
MRIMGIDPGYAIVGCGVLDYDGRRFKVLEYGAITTPAGAPFPDRLQMIYEQMDTLLARWQPAVMAVEKLYFNTNTTTAIDVAQARGVVLLAARRQGVEVSEYTPLQVKQAVVGYGRAEKRQVIEMTKKILSLARTPKPDDVADALAIAVCHAHTGPSRLDKLTAQTGGKR